MWGVGKVAVDQDDDVVWVIVIFFFQAEDGIRDLVRSRGLGDVYKRQAFIQAERRDVETCGNDLAGNREAFAQIGSGNHAAVSYTHLTLPTSDLV